MSARRRIARAIARKGKEATIYLDGTIGGKKIGADADESISLVAFREQLSAVSDAETLRVEINCEGGVVTEGMAMYHALRKCKAHKIGIVTGIAASMASVVLMACDEIRVAKGAYIMIHNPSGGARGDHEDLRKAADGIEQMRTDLLDIYEARTGVDREKLEGYLDAETYFTAEEAVEAGIADAVDDAEARLNLYAVARLDPRRLPAALHKRVVAKAPLREGLRDLEMALQAALREAYGTEQYPYVVDMFDDAVIFDLNGILMSRPYTQKDGVVALGEEETRVVRTYEKIPAARRALAKGKKQMAVKKNSAKIAELQAQLAALAAEGEEPGKKKEEETDSEEEEEETDSEEEENDEEEEEKKALASLRELTGAKSLSSLTGAVAALVARGAQGATVARAELIELAIASGKMPRGLKSWAQKCTEKTFVEFIKGLGGAKSFTGRKHTPPADADEDTDTEPGARPAAGGLSKSEAVVGKAFRFDAKTMIGLRGKPVRRGIAAEGGGK